MSSLFGKKSSKRKLHVHDDSRRFGSNGNVTDMPLDRNNDKREVNALGTAQLKLKDAVSNTKTSQIPTIHAIDALEDLGLSDQLVQTCRQLGFRKPTPVQRTLIPFLLSNNIDPVLALAPTGSGKTASFALPILHNLADDPYCVFAVVMTPTRELAQQIHASIVALGASVRVRSCCVVGGLDQLIQSCRLPNAHVCVATPGRLAALLRGPDPPRLQRCQYLVLDEADRLLMPGSGFERDMAEILLQSRASNGKQKPQTLFFSATMTASLETVQELAGVDKLHQFVIQDDVNVEVSNAAVNSQTRVEAGTKSPRIVGGEETASGSDSERERVGPKIPAGLQQEYVFMPARVRDAYLLATVRTLLQNGGRRKESFPKSKRHRRELKKSDTEIDEEEAFKANSAIIFVSTCERAALISGMLEQVGVPNVALHSLLSQHRRLAALGKFVSEHVRILVSTDVGARGLDIPHTDLVINAELPRSTVSYIHRVGRTARAGRRGRAVSLVSESDVALVHAAERLSGRDWIKCAAVTDEVAVRMLGPATKAARVTKIKLAEIGFEELVETFRERKVRDRKERERVGKALQKQLLAAAQNDSS